MPLTQGAKALKKGFFARAPQGRLCVRIYGLPQGQITSYTLCPPSAFIPSMPDSVGAGFRIRMRRG
ncbi:MAG TPA: hypothetical protein VMT20_13190 [Terriglobia bacterium]|nr:hypothetical protein [Terriglobia bacterium]